MSGTEGIVHVDVKGSGKLLGELLVVLLLLLVEAGVLEEADLRMGGQEVEGTRRLVLTSPSLRESTSFVTSSPMQSLAIFTSLPAMEA